ncbi:TonB-dependent receptor [Bacteroidales bacterium]
MKILVSLYVALVLLISSVAMQAQISISGLIRDASTGESLIGANIADTSYSNGTYTDNNGHFMLVLKIPAIVVVSYIGYETQCISIKSLHDTILNINMISGEILEEIVVKADQFRKSEVIKIGSDVLQRSPSLSGKPDVIKSLQLMPGIMPQSEASSIMLVRGGNPGENSYQLDQAPMVYVNHLGGFMSVFNPDIINSIDLYKSNFPARYGGKLSSILNITQKDGNNNALNGNLQFGITDVSFMIEGLLWPNTTFILTGRKSIFDLYMLATSALSSGMGASMFYGFHDINAKLSWKPDARSHLHLSFYYGDDYLNYYAKNSDKYTSNRNTLTNIWGNIMASAGWKYVLTPRFFFESHFAYNRYRLREKQFFNYADGLIINYFQSNFLSRLDVINLNTSGKWQANSVIKLEFGINEMLSNLLPSYYKTSNNISPVVAIKATTSETALFAESVFDLPSRFRLITGGRLTYYRNGNNAKWFPEPRIIIQKQLSEKHQISLGFMQVNQFSHLLFTSGSIINNEVWIPADNIVAPAFSDQINLGWTSEIDKRNLRIDINLYHKTLSNLTTYKDGFSNLKGNSQWYSKIETGGKGGAIGLELMLTKKFKGWNATASYALSKAWRKFPEINKGEKFDFDFDRPHALSLLIDKQINQKVTLSAAWVFQSGLPYTPVSGRHLSSVLDDEGNITLEEVLIYGERNSSRMKSYHRLDVSVSINKHNKRNQLLSSWTFGLYNAYNRKNPVYYYLVDNQTKDFFQPTQSNPSDIDPAMYQLSLFTIIPNISYKRNLWVKGDKAEKSFKHKLNKLIYYE